MQTDKIRTKGLFLGQEQIYLPSCQSTNTVLLELVRNSETEVFEGLLVWTEHQTKGRGQRNNTWHSQPSENITFSVLLRPTFLQPSEAFWITIIVALGVRDALYNLTQSEFEELSDKWQIKWTNDIFVEDQKIGGILIENSLQPQKVLSSVVGIGLNINQELFDLDRATSLKNKTGISWDKEEILSEVLLCIEKRYLQLRGGKKDLLRSDYINVLYRYQEWHFFLVDDQKRIGQILGIDDRGRLAVEIDRKLLYFNHKEIEFVY